MELTAATRERVSAFMMASRVEMIVGALRMLYGLVFLLMSLGFVVLAIRGSLHYSPWRWACVALGLEAYALTYLGLRLRKSWVVPLILFESAWLVTGVFRDAPLGLASAAVERAMWALGLWQLWFFTRPATRRFFGVEGPIVF